MLKREGNCRDGTKRSWGLLEGEILRPLAKPQGSSPSGGAIFGRVKPFLPPGMARVGTLPAHVTGGLLFSSSSVFINSVWSLARVSTHCPLRTLPPVRSCRSWRTPLRSRVRAAADWHIQGRHGRSTCLISLGFRSPMTRGSLVPEHDWLFYPDIDLVVRAVGPRGQARSSRLAMYRVQGNIGRPLPMSPSSRDTPWPSFLPVKPQVYVTPHGRTCQQEMPSRKEQPAVTDMPARAHRTLATPSA